MTKVISACLAALLALSIPARAHRLDEYLQATMIAVEKDGLAVSMRLVPGVAVLPAVFSAIGAGDDGAVPESAQRAYAQQVLRDVLLRLDGHRAEPHMRLVRFPSISELKEGLGEISIEFSAALTGAGPSHELIFENHHQPRISAYLVNCLAPQDRAIQIISQNRNQNQSFYELHYRQNIDSPNVTVSLWWFDLQAAFGNMAGAPGMFRLGIHHIAEGTDHLLFLLALLLPAPLRRLRSRWSGFAGVRESLRKILKVVTAFTVGHSLTLALAAMGLVHLPSRPVEVLIGVSILLSALHAIRPLYPGREIFIAGFFGLVHGLAFAATLEQTGLGLWERLGSILAFNLGIEAMQLAVVAATLPSLLLLSRTRWYVFVRLGAAFFACFAATGWIAERLFDFHSSVDVVVQRVAHWAPWIAGGLCLLSVLCWLKQNQPFGRLPNETSGETQAG